MATATQTPLGPGTVGRVALHPARVITLGFAAAIGVGTVLLRVPATHRSAADVGTLTALFTATSAVTVTGLSRVDVGETWNGAGLVVLMVLVQLGGLGVMTLASLVALALSDRLGLRARSLAAGEVGAVAPGELRRVLVAVAVVSLAVEGISTLVLSGWLWAWHGEPLGDAVWWGSFHAVMAFNNAGFGLAPDNLTRFAGDPVVNLVIAVSVVIGGLGFPVLAELWRTRARRPGRWTLHTKLTLAMSAALIAVGTVGVLAYEWSNPRTLGPMPVGEKLLAGLFQGVSPRTAGFNTVDIGALTQNTWLLVIVLMFIGSGAASTGGGIKVTTAAVLGLACWAELRGDPSVTVFGRRLGSGVVRQALTVTVVSIVVLGAATSVLSKVSEVPLERILFEAVSAFGTVGLSTGVTGSFGAVGQVVLVTLMFLGRVGPATLGAALVLRRRTRLYDYPEGRPLVG
jgi:trk system potassium uptake protein TrkH